MEGLYIYSATKKLMQCDFGLNRGIGVKVSTPFKSAVDGRDWVDIEVERPSLSTVSFGKTTHVENWKDYKDDFIKTIIDQIAYLLAELTQHRDRLLKEISNSATSPDGITAGG